MITHHIQKNIITFLTEHESARYSEIKPDSIEGNVFTYHLQFLTSQKLITKHDSGAYSLTAKGKLYAINNSLKHDESLQQAHAIILVCARKEGKWLLRKRLVHPEFNKIGFIHGEPRPGEAILEAGQRILQKRTSLSGTFTIRGAGYICLIENSDLVSYTSFTLLEASALTGELISRDAHGENSWVYQPDFKSQDMIPSMADLAFEVQKPGMFFLDKTYAIS